MVTEAAEADLWFAHRVPALCGARAAQTGHGGEIAVHDQRCRSRDLRELMGS